MYYYKFGHCAKLSLAELQNTALPIEHILPHGVLSSTLISIQSLGGCQYVAQLLSGTHYIPTIADHLTHSEENKKYVGIQITSQQEKSSVIQLIKSVGAKKIAFLYNEPTMGDIKRSHQVFIPSPLEYKDNRIAAMKIIEYFNQDQWAKLEENLPYTDRKRGQINLKLARTLFNLSPTQHLFDPFCGLGRNAIAVLDKLQSAVLSDISDQAITATHKNLIFAQKILDTQVQLTLTRKDATTFIPENPQQYTIISEGWLGNNSQKTMDSQSSLQSARQVISLYQKCFSLWSHAGIQNIVLCAPFYTHHPHLTPTIEKEITHIIPEQYTLKTIGEARFWHYARKNNQVGHLIFILQKRGK